VSIGVDYQTLFDASGIEVSPRKHKPTSHPTSEERIAPSWSLRYEFTQASCNEATVTDRRKVAPMKSKNEVRYERQTVTEVYENTERGVEQKFVLEAPLSPSDSEFIVQGNFKTSLSPRRQAGRGIVFSDETSDRALYTEPVVMDASGNRAPAELNLGMRESDGSWPTAIRVSGDWLKEARYPVVIDPYITSPWTESTVQAEAQLGFSVSGAGSVNGDGFADVIVSAPYFDSGRTDEGVVFAYYGSAGGLFPTPSWAALGWAEGVRFGWSVEAAGDVDGDTYSDIIVGAPFWDYWAPPPGGRFVSNGMAFVFYGGPSGLSDRWTVLNPGEEGYRLSYQEFGMSVSSAGDVNNDGFSDVIVGAPGWDSIAVYHGSRSGVSESANIRLVFPTTGSRFGHSVSTAGDFNGDGYWDVVVGIPYYYAGGVPNGGAMQILSGSVTGITTTVLGSGAGTEKDGHFGWSVSTAGKFNGDLYWDVVVGAPHTDYVEFSGKTFEDVGTVYVFFGTAGSEPEQILERSTQAGALFGYSVSTAGNVNADAYDDVIIGSPGATGTNQGRPFFGEASLFSGGPQATVTQSNYIISYFGLQENAQYGASVSTAGDIDGDGRSEVVIGAPLLDSGTNLNSGAFYLETVSPP
jgi:hypothetical protein